MNKKGIKEYNVEIEVEKMSMFVEARNKKEAEKIAIGNFYDAYNMKLEKTEIKSIKELNWIALDIVHLCKEQEVGNNEEQSLTIMDRIRGLSKW